MMILLKNLVDLVGNEFVEFLVNLNKRGSEFKVSIWNLISIFA